MTELVAPERRRWEQLGIYVALAICSQIGWIMLTAIPDESGHVFGVNSTYVTLLATVYPICYIPGSVLAARAMRRGGLRATLLESSVWMVLGSLLRLAGCVLAVASHSKVAYVVTLLGQTSMALGQPHLVNSPTALATDWFPAGERDLAGTLGLLGNIIGQALGEAMSPVIVSISHFSMATGVALVSLVLGLIPVIISFLWTYLRCETRITADKTLAVAGPRQLLEVWSTALKEDRDFRLLWYAFCLGISMFNALLSLAAQWLKPCGYSDNVVGAMTALFVLVGIPAAALCGAILDATRAYRPVLKMLLVFDLLGTAALLLAARPHFALPLYACFAFLGGCLIASSACIMDTAVELTYPKPPELSTGLLFCGGNTLSIATTYILLGLINSQHDKCRPLSAVFSSHHHTFNLAAAPVSCFIFISFAVCSFLVLHYRGPYRRLQAELEAVIEESSECGDDDGERSAHQDSSSQLSALHNPKASSGSIEEPLLP